MVFAEHAPLAPDVITYTTLIKALGAAQPSRVDEAEEIFVAMQQRTNHFSEICLPNEQTFNELMRANLRAKRPARALALFALLRSDKHRAHALGGGGGGGGSSSSSSAVKQQAGDREKMEQQKKQGGGGTSSSSSSSSSLDAVAGHPGIATYRKALQACHMLGDWRRALAVYAKMKDDGVRPDNSALLALVRVLEAAGQATLAAEIRRERSTWV